MKLIKFVGLIIGVIIMMALVTSIMLTIAYIWILFVPTELVSMFTVGTYIFIIFTLLFLLYLEE